MSKCRWMLHGIEGWGLIVPILLVASSGVTAEQTAQVPMATPLNSSVCMFNEHGFADAVRQVELIHSLGCNRASFVVTLQADTNKDQELISFGLMRSNGRYQPADEQLRSMIKQYLKKAFQKAIELGMDITVLVHLDAANSLGGWRNMYDFDPEATYLKHTYEEFVLGTIVDALRETTRLDTNVEIVLAGEMGRSVFGYPASYLAIMKRLKTKLPRDRFKTGISLNWNNLAGGFEPNAKQQADMQQLLQECDFLGISMYHPIKVEPTPHDFVVGIEHFSGELAKFGVTIPPSIELHFSEVGLGGCGQGQSDPKAVATTADVANAPFSGTSDIKLNPWTSPEMKTLRQKYHQALLDFLRTQPARWKVNGAYLWSYGSWDPQGINLPTFADPAIVEMIHKHNQLAR